MPAFRYLLHECWEEYGYDFELMGRRCLMCGARTSLLEEPDLGITVCVGCERDANETIWPDDIDDEYSVPEPPARPTTRIP